MNNMRGICLLLTASALLAQGIPNSAAAEQWIVDSGGMLNEKEQSRARGLLERIYRHTKAQIVVYTVPRVAGGSPREFAVRQFREWKLGSAERNDGVLVFLAREERAAEIVTGSGLSERLPSQAMEALVRQRMTPLLRGEQAGEAVIDAVKEIGATIAGFSRAQPPPLVPLFGLALGFGIVGLGAAAVIHRFQRQPMRLPPAGRRREEHHYAEGYLDKSKFMQNKTRQFFLQQAFSLLPPGHRKYPAPALWAAVAGLSVAAGAGAGLGIAWMNTDLEPVFWVVSIGVGLASAVTAAALYGPWKDETTGLAAMVLKVGIPAGLAGGAFASAVFWSEFALAGWIAPLYVAAVNGAVGTLMAKTMEEWNPKRFVCEKCAGDLQELPQAEIPALLRDWEPRALREGIVRFRGWRCRGKCTDVYLAHVVAWDANVCPKCRRSAVLINSKKGWRTLACFACGSEQKEKMTAAQTGGYSKSSNYTPAASGGSTSDEYDSNRYSGSSYEPPPSGGATDGDGASGRW